MPANKISLEDPILRGELSLETVLNAFTDGVYDYNVQNKVTFVNDNFYRILGYEPGEFEITDERWDNLIHPDDLEEANRLFIDHLEGRCPRYAAEYRMLHKNGTYQWMSCTGQLVAHDEEGNPGQVVGAIRSIDTRKQIEIGMNVLIHASNTLRGKEFFRYMGRHLSQILSVNYVVITAFDADSPSILKPLVMWERDQFNDAFEYEIKGTPCEIIYTRKESLIVGSGLAAQFPDDEYLIENNIASYFGVPFWNLSHELIGHMAVMCDQEMEVKPWMEHMMELFAQAIGAEVERIKNEEKLSELNEHLDAQVRERTIQLEKAVEDLDSFFYKASHDLRAPITTLEGIYNLLSSEIDTEEKARLFNLLGAQINGIKKLNRSIIEVGNVRNHKYHPESIQLNALLDKVLDDLYIPVDFHVNKAPVDPSVIVENDEFLLNTLIKEFISNGIKHRKEDHNDASVSIDTEISEGLISIIIRDNGKGISNRLEQDYFKLFLRASATSSGFGLGLYRAKLAADKTGAGLNIESKEGEGTKVTLTLKQG